MKWSDKKQREEALKAYMVYWHAPEEEDFYKNFNQLKKNRVHSQIDRGIKAND